MSSVGELSTPPPRERSVFSKQEQALEQQSQALEQQSKVSSQQQKMQPQVGIPTDDVAAAPEVEVEKTCAQRTIDRAKKLRASGTYYLLHPHEVWEITSQATYKLGKFTLKGGSKLGKLGIQSARNWVKTTVLPLSSPPGWDAKMKKAKYAEKRLLKQKKRLEDLLSGGQLPKHSDRIQSLTRLLVQVNKALEARKSVIEHLENEKRVQIRARVVCNIAAPVANVALPGVGLGTFITTATTALMLGEQSSSASQLPSDSYAALEARKITNRSTALTIAGKISSITVNYFVPGGISSALKGLASTVRELVVGE